MPKTKSEPTKKHGDTLEELIDETGNDSSRGRRDESADDDPAQRSDDDDTEESDERT